MASPGRDRTEDHQRFIALYQRRAEELLMWFVRRTADPEIALDLWAETFALALEHWKSLRGSSEAQTTGWLYGIARNQLALYHRRGAAERRALRNLGMRVPAAAPDVIARIEQRADMAKSAEEIARGLGQLSAAAREAVELRVICELSFAEVAGQLGISECAARARVSRALCALAENLEHSSEVSTT